MDPRFPNVIDRGNVILTLTPDEVYLEYREDLSSDEIDRFLRDYNLESVQEEISTSRPHHTLTHSQWLRFLRQVGAAEIAQYIGNILADDRIKLVSPVYHRLDMSPRKTDMTLDMPELGENSHQLFPLT